MVGLLVIILLLGLVFGFGTVLHLTTNLLLIALAVTLVLGLAGYFGMRGRGGRSL
ncbi:MAG: hypothetical protein WC211_00965 [Dehalococcoidia bacterium]